MISHIMLNLKTYTQERNVVTFGNVDKPMAGKGSSRMPSTGMAPRPAGVTTVATLTLTLLAIDPHAYARRPRTMLGETLERLGAPMMEIEQEFDGEYQEINSLPVHLAEDPHPSSGPLGPNLQSGSPIALVPLSQAPTRERGSPYLPMFNAKSS